MPHTAPALGLGLRLRSRRVRSDRPRVSTFRLAVSAALVAALIGFIGSALRDGTGLPVPWSGSRPASASSPRPSVPEPRPLPLEEQLYADALWAIHSQVEHTTARVGLGTAFYHSHEIDRRELWTRLNQSLSSYRQAELQIESLAPPPALRSSHAAYLAAVRLCQESAIEMLRMYEDGDEEHLSTALPLSLAGTGRLREVVTQFWPEEAYPST